MDQIIKLLRFLWVLASYEATLKGNKNRKYFADFVFNIKTCKMTNVKLVVGCRLTIQKTKLFLVNFALSFFLPLFGLSFFGSKSKFFLCWKKIELSFSNSQPTTSCQLTIRT